MQDGAFDVSMEQKRKIVARNFFTENREQYKDYAEAREELSNDKILSDAFIDFAVEPYLRMIEGCDLITNDQGHVLSIRISDGFVEPITMITDEEIREMQDKYMEAGKEHGLLNRNLLIEKIGWTFLKPKEAKSETD